MSENNTVVEETEVQSEEGAPEAQKAPKTVAKQNEQRI